MTKIIKVWGCELCDEIYEPDIVVCPECNVPTGTLSERVASGYVIQFHAKDKQGQVTDIHELTIEEGDIYLGLHIEGFIENVEVETIEIKLAPSDELSVRQSERHQT